MGCPVPAPPPKSGTAVVLPARPSGVVLRCGYCGTVSILHAGPLKCEPCGAPLEARARDHRRNPVPPFDLVRE